MGTKIMLAMGTSSGVRIILIVFMATLLSGCIPVSEEAMQEDVSSSQIAKNILEQKAKGGLTVIGDYQGVYLGEVENSFSDERFSMVTMRWVTRAAMVDHGNQRIYFFDTRGDLAKSYALLNAIDPLSAEIIGNELFFQSLSGEVSFSFKEKGLPDLFCVTDLGCS